jgi:DnaJ-class molecular chaperone
VKRQVIFQMNTKKNFYQTLGLLETADDVVIKAAYKALAQKHHPDKHKTHQALHTQKMMEINEAFAALGSKAKRKAYDESRQPASRGHAKPKPASSVPDHDAHLIAQLKNATMDEMAVVGLFEKVFSTSVQINAGWMNSYSYKEGASKITLDFKALKLKIIEKLAHA